ncbi:MAG: 3-phosphoshikimate 1-carboxyvinyltransferase [Candidatus Margulisiibacteriota bacterium]|jgi:3-phosphoshikimate 1-carboxyvinyltransferase
MKEITLPIPGDKSISHRAVIFASLSNYKVSFSNFLAGEDCINTIQCFREMGVAIVQKGSAVTVQGVGLQGLKKPGKALYVGNSGTSIRLLTGILAAQKFDSEISGDSSIQTRPMKRIIEPLTLMGAKISGQEREGNIYPSLKIRGGQQLQGLSYKMPVASAQVDSCLRLAGLCAGVDVQIDKQGMQYRDHTEKMLQWFKALEQGSLHFTIPSDISSAAFFIVAGLLKPNTKIILENINYNPTRNGIIKVLQSMGGNITVIKKLFDPQIYLEPVADIIVESSKLRGTLITKELIPTLIDEIPIIALAAALAVGTTEILGAEELRYKESDRLKTIAQGINMSGGKITERPDGLLIQGVASLWGGSACSTSGDHRIAMMLQIANLVAKQGITVDDTECIKTSFPEFGEMLRQIQ